ncbi:hypothetical protein UlMin_011865 [Ulmus minor]
MKSNIKNITTYYMFDLLKNMQLNLKNILAFLLNKVKIHIYYFLLNVWKHQNNNGILDSTQKMDYGRAALATLDSEENSSRLKMSMALASATQLLAKHCIEMAEIAGADHERVTSIVQSAVDIQSPSDLMTLTSAAATALRGEAALKSRLLKKARKNASISLFDKGILEPKSSSLYSKMEEQGSKCVGDLLQVTQKAVDLCLLSSQIIIKIKSKHVGGAFSKNNKCKHLSLDLYTAAWSYQKERELSEDVFGLKTAQGLLEFKCKSKFHKQRWVEGLRNLLRRVAIEETEGSLGFLSISNSI